MPDLTYHLADKFGASRCRSDSAPIDERTWGRCGRIVDADGVMYDPSNGQPAYIRGVPTTVQNWPTRSDQAAEHANS